MVVDIIRDVNVEEAFIATAEMLVEFYEVNIHNSYLDRNFKVFADLFTEMQNNTRVPRNCGYTAMEMVEILR